ncbi:DUF603 domain-containing protein [Borrelia persica]|nr:DUF603 domain-containing protein [Borrelia persica]
MKLKKSYEDYVMYFSEGQLSDSEIAKEIEILRTNVCNKRSINYVY